ncbi:MAG: carbohydrate binding domain-containing protein [Lentisphaeria bacterium]|nr:carbohydrate binding domain-containing protein [Lentisphaeria bacterium]
MRNTLTVLALCTAFTLSAGNILQNADWQKKSSANLPLQWQLRGSADGVKIEGDSITLGKNDQDIWLIQYLPDNTVKGKKYELSYTASGKGVFRPYVEWQYISEGKKKWRSSGAKLRNLTDVPETEKIVFTLADNSLRPYAVINVPKGNLVTLKNLKLVPFTEPLLLNADFALKAANGAPADWNRRGKAEQFSFADGKAVLKSSAGKNAYLIQNMKQRLLPGATYQASCKVSGRADSAFRCYVESSLLTNGQRSTRAFHHQWMSLKDKEENISFKFTMGKNAVGALFVLNIKDAAEVVFSDLKLELVSAPENPVAMETPAEFTGSWQGKNIAAQSNHLTVFRNSNAVRKVQGLKPGKKYQLSHSSRGEGKSDSDSGFYFYDTFIRFANGKKIRLAHEDTAKALQNKSYTFTAETATAEVEILPLGADKLILREIQLRQAPADAAILPELSFYLQRNTIYSKLPQKSVTGRLTNPHNAVSAKITFNGKTYDAVKSGKDFRFTLDTANLKTGSYDVSAQLTAANGKNGIAKSKITVLPPAPVEVTVGQGRRFYVNGKAYFPVGMWSLPNMNNILNLKFAAKHGINFIKTPLSDPLRTKKFLDTADKLGMKVCFNTGTPADESDGAFRSWLHSVESVLTPEVLNHPALFCYFLRDEPFWVGYPLKVLERCYKELQRLDPYRPVWINAAPRGSYADQKPFAKLCGIYGVDIYPIPDSANHSHLEDKSVACVGKYALRKAEIAGDTKPVAMALQGFSWRAFLDKKESPRSIYPTAHETRFMTFDCIINESALVSWWGNGYILVPEFYNVLFAQFDELRRLDTLLTESELSRRKETADGIEYRVFTGKTYKVIIAANAADAERKGTFSGEFSSDNVTEWTAKRKIRLNSGKFTDTFAPYAVHIYFEGKVPELMSAPANDPSAGNPFAEAVKMRVNGRIYDGKACWIWEKDNINKVGSSAVIRKTFTVNGKADAVIHISADDQAEIYCNGKKAGTVADWTFMQRFDLSKFLKDGENTVEIHAADGGMMPCGVLAELHVNNSVYPTGSDWLAAKTPGGTFAPAGVVAKSGSGVWGRGVRYCPGNP